FGRAETSWNVESAPSAVERRDLGRLPDACLAGGGMLGRRSGGGEDEHPPQVPRHCHEAPLAAHFVEAAQQKLTESKRRLDDAEHRLWRLLAQRIELAAFGRLQPMGHGLDRRRIFRRGPFLRETLAKRG